MKLEDFYTTKEYTIESLGVLKETVYDVEVEDTHNFFGNDILIHNSIWADADAANVLKAALDSYDERVISWVSKATINVTKMPSDEREVMNDNIDLKLATDPGEPIKLPSEFEYHGRIIFISNLPMSKMDAAVLNRSAKIDMTLTDDQIFHRMEGIIDHLGNKNVPKDVKLEILGFIKQQTAGGKITAPSMRTYVAAEDFYRSGLPNWKELLDFA